MPDKKFVFETGLRAVETLTSNGKLITLSKDKSYTTSDPEEAEALRLVKGVNEVSRKEN